MDGLPQNHDDVGAAEDRPGTRSGRAAIPQDSHADLLTIEEFVQWCHLSMSTVRRLVKKGYLPHVQFGGKRHRILIYRSVLLPGTDGDGAVAAAFEEGHSRGEGNCKAVLNKSKDSLPGPKPKWRATIG